MAQNFSGPQATTLQGTQVQVPFNELLAPAGFLSEGIVVALNAAGAFISRAAAAIRRRNRINRTVAELSALDARTRRDIGLEGAPLALVAEAMVDWNGRRRR